MGLVLIFFCCNSFFVLNEPCGGFPSLNPWILWFLHFHRQENLAWCWAVGDHWEGHGEACRGLALQEKMCRFSSQCLCWILTYMAIMHFTVRFALSVKFVCGWYVVVNFLASLQLRLVSLNRSATNWMPWWDSKYWGTPHRVISFNMVCEHVSREASGSRNIPTHWV